MVRPNLLNPAITTIDRIDRTETQWDSILRENINIIRRRPSFDIESQIVYRKVFVKGSLDASDLNGSMGEGLGGSIPNSDGYILLRVYDLGLKGLTMNDIERGDRITKLGQLDVDYYVVGKRPAAQYTDQGGFTLIAVFFEDRNP